MKAALLAALLASQAQAAEVLVKLESGAALEIEAELDPLMELARPRSSRLAGLFAGHKVKRLRPVYPELLREKKDKRADLAGIAGAMQAQFPSRSRRARAEAAWPELSRTFVLELDAASEEAALAALREDPAVEFAVPNAVYSKQLVPNDPYYSSNQLFGPTHKDLYGLWAISAATAWDSSAGEGVVVAVVDTGLDYAHADLAANVWLNPKETPGNGKDDDANGFVDDTRGWNFVSRSKDPMDNHGHGTHVSGTIAAVGNNGIGVIGVAWKAKVMALKALDAQGSGKSADLANAIYYAARNGADVINASWGGLFDDPVIADAISFAARSGVVFVAAAGNNNRDASFFFPASAPDAITVSAFDRFGTKAYFSNWGTRVDVAAPGVDVLSAKWGGGYVAYSGTSMAAPHVAGLAALVLSRHPEFTTEQLRQALRSSTDRGTGSPSAYYGYGRVDASLAVAIGPVLEARIRSPLTESPLGALNVVGSANGPGFARYLLEYGLGDAPSSWTPIQDSGSPAAGSPLGQFQPPSGASRVLLRLTVWDSAGRAFSDRIGLREMAAHWKFDDRAWGITDDASGNQNYVSLIDAPQYVPGVLGYALSFNGGNSARAPNTLSLSPNKTMTVSAWVRPAALGKDQAIVSKWKGGTSNDNSYLLRFSPTPSFSILQSNNVVKTIKPTVPHQVGEWMLLTAVADGQYLSLYKNGVRYGAPVAYNGTIKYSSPDVRIARLRYADTAQSFNGAIDDVRVYARALQPAEVQALYAQGAAAAAASGPAAAAAAYADDGSIWSDRPGTICGTSSCPINDFQSVTADPRDGALIYAGTLGLRRYSAAGSWTRAGIKAKAAVIDSAGNIYVTGHILGVTDLGSGPMTPNGASDAVIAKYRPNGSLVWARNFGSPNPALQVPSDESGKALALDGAGDLFVAGSLVGPADFGAGVRPAFGNLDGFIAKFSGQTGSHLWSQIFGSSGYGVEEGAGLAVMPGGDAVLTGSADGRNALLQRLRGADGASIWSRTFGGGKSYGKGVAADAAGEIFLTGTFFNSMSIDSASLIGPNGSYDYRFAARFSPSGTARWAKRLGGGFAVGFGITAPSALALTPAGELLVTGIFGGSNQDFGGVMLSSVGGYDGFLARLSKGGDTLYARGYGSSAADWFASVASDRRGDALLAGLATTNADGAPFTPIDFGDGPQPANGKIDVFVARVPASLDRQAPTVRVLSPRDDTDVQGVVSLRAAAEDDTGVVRVAWLIDGEEVYASDEEPYEFQWQSGAPRPDPYRITAVASDAAGREGSASVEVYVAYPAPSAAFTSPAPGAQVSGIVPIEAEAASAAGIARVEFLVDGVRVHAATQAPYRFDWDTARVASGLHTLDLRAINGKGRASSPVPMTVTVRREASAAKMVADIGAPATVAASDSFASLALPAHAFGSPTALSFDPVDAPGLVAAQSASAGQAYELGPPSLALLRPGVLTVPYTGGIPPALSVFEAQTQSWRPLAGSRADPQTRTVSAPIERPGIYAPMADPAQARSGALDIRELRTYPNPARSGARVHVELPSFADSVELTLFNMAGELVGRLSLNSASLIGERYVYEQSLDLSGRPSGVYVIAAQAVRSGQPASRRTARFAIVR